MIEVEHVGKLYGTFPAVRDVTFHAESNEIVGLLGPNGAGKTTIMKILTCYHFPSSGSVRLNGYDIYDDALEVKRSVGYLPENAPVYGDLTVLEYLDFIAEVRYPSTGRYRVDAHQALRKERLEWAVEECGLGPMANRSISTLSKGYRQRTGLAQAILHDPAILILDEPTSGLDPNQIIEIRKLIARLGSEKTVLLSTHILQEVEATCDRVLILNEGNIVAEGTTDEIGRDVKGDTIFSVELKVRGAVSSEALGSSIGAITGLTRMLALDLDAAGDRAKVQVAMNPSSGGGEAIFDWAVDNGHKIVAMTPQRVSLEEIFTRLTTGRGNDEEEGRE